MTSKNVFLAACIPMLIVLLASGCASDDQIASEALNRQVEEARERLEDSPGGQRILDAINAHGGLEAWYQAPTSSYTWEYANVEADMQFKSFLVADNATRRVYHNLLTVGTYGNPEPVDAQFAWDGTDAWMYPPDIEKVNPRFWATSGYYFEQIPFVFADPGVNYDVLDDDTLNGQPHRLVRVPSRRVSVIHRESTRSYNRRSCASLPSSTGPSRSTHEHSPVRNQRLA